MPTPGMTKASSVAPVRPVRAFVRPFVYPSEYSTHRDYSKSFWLRLLNLSPKMHLHMTMAKFNYQSYFSRSRDNFKYVSTFACHQDLSKSFWLRVLKLSPRMPL